MKDKTRHGVIDATWYSSLTSLSAASREAASPHSSPITL